MGINSGFKGLNIIRVKFRRFMPVVRHAVSRRLSPRRPVFGPRSDYMRFVVGKVALGQGFLRVLRLSRVSVIPPTLRTHFHLHVIPTRANERSLESFQNAMLYRKSESTG